MSGPLSFRKRKRATGDVAERMRFECTDFDRTEKETERKNQRNRALWWARFKRDPLTDAVPNAQARQG